MKIGTLFGGVVLASILVSGVSSFVYYSSTQETIDVVINQVNRSSDGGTEVLLSEDPGRLGRYS